MKMREKIRRVVTEAFFEVHQGRSTDDVVIHDGLNQQFIQCCRRTLPDTGEFELNWALLNLRKSSSLGPVVTKTTRQSHDDYVHAAEIAARHLEDKHGLTIDRVLCTPQFREEFDQAANKLARNVDPCLLRKAALKLRKGRQLRPEVVKRAADWGTHVLRFDAKQLQEAPDTIPRQPGVYLFSDATGYLYIGEASNLRTRVSKHLDHSDRKALARYLWEQGVVGLIVELHVFDPTSKGRLAAQRRAYEANLIQTRKPRFNIQV